MSELPYDEDEINRAMELAVNADRVKQAAESIANRIDTHPTERGRILSALHDLQLDGDDLMEEDPIIFPMVLDLAADALEAFERRQRRM